MSMRKTYRNSSGSMIRLNRTYYAPGAVFKAFPDEVACRVRDGRVELVQDEVCVDKWADVPREWMMKALAKAKINVPKTTSGLKLIERLEAAGISPPAVKEESPVLQMENPELSDSTQE